MLSNTVYRDFKLTARAKYKIGTWVRISKYKTLFSKGYHRSWTFEIFKIVDIRNTLPVTYILEDYYGNPILGTFYEFEIKPTKFPNEFLYTIVKKRGKKALVHWLGYDKKYDSEITL